MTCRSAFALAVLFLVPACGGTGAGSGAQPRQFTMGFGAIEVPAGTEHTQCIVKRLDNPEPLHVGAVHNVLGEASHHMVVYRTNDTVEQTTPFDCRPFADTLDPSKGSPVMITQKKDDLLQLPEGVAYVLDPHQMMRVELHYINATNASVTLDATTTMVETLDMREEANFMLIGDPDIVLPAQKSVTLGPIFYPLDPLFADAKFFAITGHEHQLGTNVKVAVAGSDSDPGSMVYDVANWTWSEPATVVHDPAFTVPSGGGFRFTCDWFNPAPAGSPPVTFGESAEDEMCFFWAYYYPSHGTQVCLHSEQGGQVSNHCLK
jgi:hypothetical protein